MLDKISADDILRYFSNFFFQKKDFDIACKLSPLETICMKCQILFSKKKKKKKRKKTTKKQQQQKKKKKLINLSSTELAQRVKRLVNFSLKAYNIYPNYLDRRT